MGGPARYHLAESGLSAWLPDENRAIVHPQFVEFAEHVRSQVIERLHANLPISPEGPIIEEFGTRLVSLTVFPLHGDVGQIQQLCERIRRLLDDLPVEVRSVKLEYQEHYRQLLDALVEGLVALAFSAHTPTALPTVIEVPERGSPYLRYLLLRHLMQPHRLRAYFSLVDAQPHRHLIREPVQVDFSRARGIDARTLTDLVTPAAGLTRYSGGALSPVIAHSLRGHAPTRLLDTRAYICYDTPENRFVAHLLRTLEQELHDLERAFRQDAEEHPARAEQAESLIKDCRCWARQVAQMERAAFLAEVGPMTVFPASSQVLQQREGYRELRDAYLQLLLSPRVRWEALEELLQVPSKDLATLYEYWCFFALADALARATGSSPDWRNLVRWEGDRWEIWLQQGQEATLYIGPATLWYNREFRRDSYSLPLRPDYTVQAGGRRWLFDAKYRLEWKDVEAALEEEKPIEDDREATFKRVDLYKMHTYRDAIQGTAAVFILYPGTVFRAFGTDRKQYENPTKLPSNFEGVGAIPLLPGRTAALEEVVRKM